MFTTWTQKPQTDHMGITKTNHRHLYPCPPRTCTFPLPTHPDISESINAVDLIGYWCHKFEAKIHPGPTSLYCIPLLEVAFNLPFLLAIWNSIFCICIKYFQNPFRSTTNFSFRFFKSKLNMVF